MDVLTQGQVQAALIGLDAGPFDDNIRVYESVGSTNDLLREMAEAGAPEGTILTADEQTAGRGRMGRTWTAPKGDNLLMSILFRPDGPAADIYRAVMVCGLAASDVLGEAAGRPVDIKWPNDLQIGGRKIGGILPESAIVGDRAAWVIVGMGLNINQTFPAGDPLHGAATSLREATGEQHSRAALLAHIAVRLNAWHSQIDGPALLDVWRSRCVTLGQTVRVETPGGTVEGLAEDIGEHGELWLRDDAGQRHSVAAGEATLRR